MSIDCVFNQDKERIRLQTLPIKTLPGSKHSVLTLHFEDTPGHPTRQALDEIISYFRHALAPVR